METQSKYNLKPTFGDSLGAGWQVMLDNFLRLFLVVLVLGVLTAPLKFNFHFDSSDFRNLPWHWHGSWNHFFGLASLGIGTILSQLPTGPTLWPGTGSS